MYFATKNKLGTAINDVGYSNYELLNRINDKYYCNLNKDTFMKTISLDERDSNTLNLNCVIFICKYLNLDLNDIFEIGTIGKSHRISNNIMFPIKDGKYSFIMRSTFFSSKTKVGNITIDSSKNDDSIVILTIDDSHYKTADIRPSKSGYFS